MSIINYNYLIDQKFRNKYERGPQRCYVSATKHRKYSGIHVSILFTILIDLFSYYRQVLNEHRYNCETEGKYVEAEMAQKRLEELK